MADFAQLLDKPASDYQAAAGKALGSFDRFWNEEAGFCYDVLDGPDGHEADLRPNQLLAVSLPCSPLDEARQRAVVDSCARFLLTSHGLRTLSPDDPKYTGHYGGNQQQRDGAYHQGTVWSWLTGPFIDAHLRVYHDPKLARTYIQPLIRNLDDHGIGSISEIFDGDPPFVPRGCIAQAWSVAQLLHAWQSIESASQAQS
jgi:glycogen debranching enzyme